MSRRRILEDDSDDDDHGGGGRTVTPNGDFFTDEEKEAIDKCKIQTNDNWGIYSDDYTSRAIAKIGGPPLETVAQDGTRLLYQKYRVKPGSERGFFERDIYKVHGPKPDASCDPECLEEAILLEIEAIRRSEKAAKNRMFKNKETGGMVVFGPWFNYALQRLLRLSSSDVGRTATAASLGEYTAVKIIRSLFSLITEDLKEVIKPGKLHLLKTTMGVDWEENLNTARKVINHCGGSDHFLYKEFAILEAHVESLKSKTKPPPPAVAVSFSSSASNTTMVAAPANQAQVNADSSVPRQDSDSKDNGQVGSGKSTPNDVFFTDEEKEAIDRCRIQINDNCGIYSDDCAVRAMEMAGGAPLEQVAKHDEIPLYRNCRVKVGSQADFFGRDLYKVHDPNRAPVACDPICSEEAILLEIQALRISDYAFKKRMFVEKGGKVVFGPWFNYAFQRLLQLPLHDIDQTKVASVGEYTAIKIIRSLFCFLTKDLNEVVKPGSLEELKTNFGVDWVGNVNIARKVVNHCGGWNHFLHADLTIVEAHVKRLKIPSKRMW